MKINTSIKFSPVNIEARKKLDIRPGDTVRIYINIKEKGKTRLQAFKGVVLARRHGTEPGATFTVRREGSNGPGNIGVERIFPLFSPMINKVEILKRARVRRAKLFYIRDKVSREIRKKMRATTLSEKDQIIYKEEAPVEKEKQIEVELETETKPDVETVVNKKDKEIKVDEKDTNLVSEKKSKKDKKED